MGMCASSVNDARCLLLVWCRSHYIQQIELYFVIEVRKHFMPHCATKVYLSASVLSSFLIVCFFVTGSHYISPNQPPTSDPPVLSS